MVGIVQLAEHRIVVPGVVGSSPITHPRKKKGDLLGLLSFFRVVMGLEEGDLAEGWVKKCPVDTFLARGPRALAPPVAGGARAQCVQRSARNEPALSGEVSAGHRKRRIHFFGLSLLYTDRCRHSPYKICESTVVFPQKKEKKLNLVDFLSFYKQHLVFRQHS